MNWKIDVQRGLAWTIILSFVGILMLFSMMAAIGSLNADILDFYKQFGNVLTNIVLLVMGFFFGSSQGSKDKDNAMSNVVERLTPVPPANGVVAPEVVAAAATAAAPAAAAAAAPAAAAAAAPPAADVAAPPAAEVAVAAALAERDAHNP